MKKKIAIIFRGDPQDRKGYFNAVHNRVKHLTESIGNEFIIEPYLLQYREPLHIRLLRKTKKKSIYSQFTLDGITYQNLWQTFSLLDYLLEKNNYKSIFLRRFIKSKLPEFSTYNLIIGHSFDCILMAHELFLNYSIPYIATWHGSDIHTAPFKNRFKFKETDELIRDASLNIFVSKQLMLTSNIINNTSKKEVSYNGVSSAFFRYDNEKRSELRIKKNVANKNVVAFVGNLYEIKNALLLPDIFNKIKSVKNLVFWIIGDGKLRGEVQSKCDALGLTVVFWGNQKPESIPDFLNCIDILVLPSKNEGLPLIVLEAMACGCEVFTSKVGGIPEILDEKHTFKLNETFIEDISQAIDKSLSNGEYKHFSRDMSDFKWEKIADNESAMIKDIIL